MILTNALNIINGVQPYDEFIAGLAGTYTDRDGVQHKAEDENQAWRRFPMILCVRADDFTVLINKGFVDNDLSSVKAMHMYARVRGSMRAIMQRLEGAAREQALQKFGGPVRSAVKMIEDSHNNRISDPNQIPPELMPQIEYYAESFQQAERDEKARGLEEIVAMAELYNSAWTSLLVEFACWFWSSISGGLAWHMMQNPVDWDDPTLEIRFAQDDDALRKAVDACKFYFGETVIDESTGYVFGWLDMYPRRPCDDILGAVKVAWRGCFGDIKSLNDDPGYPNWVHKTF